MLYENVSALHFRKTICKCICRHQRLFQTVFLRRSLVSPPKKVSKTRFEIVGVSDVTKYRVLGLRDKIKGNLFWHVIFCNYIDYMFCAKEIEHIFHYKAPVFFTHLCFHP